MGPITSHTHLGIALSHRSPSFHQESGNFKMAAREGVVERSHPLAQGTTGIVDVGTAFQQQGHNIWSKEGSRRDFFFFVCLFVFEEYLLNKVKNSESVTIVAVVAGLMKGGPAAVVPGVHRMALMERKTLFTMLLMHLHNHYCFKMNKERQEIGWYLTLSSLTLKGYLKIIFHPPSNSNIKNKGCTWDVSMRLLFHLSVQKMQQSKTTTLTLCW